MSVLTCGIMIPRNDLWNLYKNDDLQEGEKRRCRSCRRGGFGNIRAFILIEQLDSELWL